MNRFKKILVISALTLIGVAQFSSASALNLLPGGKATEDEDAASCEKWIKDFEYAENPDGKSLEELFKETKGQDLADGMDFFLGCAIKSGYIRFWMIPFFVSYALNFIISLAGLIIVAMIIIGAYYYIAGGLTDDKEKGKTIIKYALYGFVLVLSSWTLVNILLLALTS
jgi:hypothetical protein